MGNLTWKVPLLGMTDSVKPQRDKGEKGGGGGKRERERAFSCMDGFFGTKKNKPIKPSFIGSNKDLDSH